MSRSELSKLSYRVKTGSNRTRPRGRVSAFDAYIRGQEGNERKTRTRTDGQPKVILSSPPPSPYDAIFAISSAVRGEMGRQTMGADGTSSDQVNLSSLSVPMSKQQHKLT